MLRELEFQLDVARETYGPRDRRAPEYVRWVQHSLSQLLGGGLRVDGIDGPRTRAAVRAFQTRYRVRPIDGIVGPITEAALVRAGASPLPAGRAVAPPGIAPAPAHAVDHFIARAAPLPAPSSLRVTNYLDPAVHRFTAGSRRTGQTVNEMVVHETVTRSVRDTVNVLVKRGLSVHMILGPDGSVSQHGDLGDALHYHAGSGHNLRSVGVEVVNPYYPRYLKPGLAWGPVLSAGWAHEGRYVLPTPAQAEATARLLNWITSPAARGLSIPRQWIGVSGGRMAMSRVTGANRSRPGIYAHCYFGHADGAWLVLYAWLRLEAGYSPAQAYADAARRATTRHHYVELP
jgi:N-acetyl-anhydromuramyl-L-alanine amidase AmpD